MDRLQRKLKKAAVTLIVGDDGEAVRLEKSVKDAEPRPGWLDRIDESFGIDDLETPLAAESLDVSRRQFAQPFSKAEARKITADLRMSLPVGFGKCHPRAPAGEYHRVLAGVRAKLQKLGATEQLMRQHQFVDEQFTPLGGVDFELFRQLEISERRQHVLTFVILEELGISHFEEPSWTRADRVPARCRTARRSRRHAADASSSRAAGR